MTVYIQSANKLPETLWRRGGNRKESLKLRLWNLNVCIEMLVGGDDISNGVITLRHVFFNVCLHSRSFPLCADWRKFDSSVDEEPQGNWRWNSNSRDVVSSSPSSSPPSPPERPGELAHRLVYILRWKCSEADRTINSFLYNVFLQDCFNALSLEVGVGPLQLGVTEPISCQNYGIQSFKNSINFQVS